MGIHELCQVRKEAALSGRSHVPQGNLSRANCLSNAYGRQSTEGARLIHKLKTHLYLRGGFFNMLISGSNGSSTKARIPF